MTSEKGHGMKGLHTTLQQESIIEMIYLEMKKILKYI